MTPTQFSTVQDKEKFVAQFKKFVESDFSANKFPKWFYTRLSMTFGHIAHFNQGGFFDVFFRSNGGKLDFLRRTLKYECYGSPDYTFSDAEREIQNWIKEGDFEFKYLDLKSAEIEAGERAEYERLKAKFGA